MAFACPGAAKVAAIRCLKIWLLSWNWDSVSPSARHISNHTHTTSLHAIFIPASLPSFLPLSSLSLPFPPSCSHLLPLFPFLQPSLPFHTALPSFPTPPSLGYISPSSTPLSFPPPTPLSPFLHPSIPLYKMLPCCLYISLYLQDVHVFVLTNRL